ncbi:MAG: hypothetical protein AAF943_14010 [Pseudomonadota bacterium]
MSDLSKLLLLHQAAAPYGVGLNPKLLALAQRVQVAAGPGVVALNMPVTSAGPSHQSATAEDLENAGVTRLHAKQSSVSGGDDQNGESATR